MIFVQQKQWNKVREAIQNPDDALIVEGYPVHEPRFNGITVYALHCSTGAIHGQIVPRLLQPAVAYIW
jgi:hypothetical protein